MNSAFFRRFLVSAAMFLTAAGVIFAQQDSLGVVERDGSYFIKHQVQKGQGFYAISKKYNVPIDKIITANPETRSGLNVDQIVYIPLDNYTPTTTAKKETPPQPASGNANGAATHTVKPGETLYRIATAYNLTVEELMELNGLKNNSISVGQVLVVSKGGKSSTTVKPAEEVKTVRVPEKPLPVTTPAVTTTVTEAPKGKGNEVTEKGNCLWDKENELEENNRYVALHPTLPVGTIVMVTNQAANKSAFVRITGNTEPKDKGIALKISQGTAQLLKIAPNQPTPVVISYTQY